MLVNAHYRIQHSPVAQINVRVASTEQYIYTTKQERQQIAVPGPKSCRGPKSGIVIPHLFTVRQWHSCKPRQRESITLVTQLSLERCGTRAAASAWPERASKGRMHSLPCPHFLMPVPALHPAKQIVPIMDLERHRSC
jgi:hypothetical protein